MNNIQKNFKAKRGLCMAQGGLIDQLDPSGKMSRMDLGALTNDPTVLNAAMDREGLAAEQARQASHPGQAFMNPVAPPQRQAAPVQQVAPVQQPSPLGQLGEPVPTSFEQDNTARGLRIQGYGDKLAGMRKQALGLADGTANIAQAAQPESPEQVMARMAAKYGVSAQPTAAPVQAPQPVQQAPAPQRQGLMGAAMGLIGGRKAAIDRATGYAEGGIVRGKGGPTDDEVPMQVGGKDVNLSNSEAVLPVKTVHALGGPEAVEELIEETNGKPPVRGGLRAGGAYFTGTGGDVIDPKALRPEFRAVAQTPVIEPAPNAMQEGAQNYRAQNAQVKTAQPQGFYEKMGRQMGAEGGAVRPAPTPATTLGERALGAGRAFALNPATAIPTGVMLTKYAADAVDSFPSLRGRATAEASNMELAGTPQHDAEVNSALVAKDAAWEQRHGKTLSDAQRTPMQKSSTTAMVEGKGTGKFEMPEFDRAGGNNELTAARANGRFDNSPERALVDRTLGEGAAVPQGLRNRWADNDPMKAQQYMSKDNAASGLRNNPADGHGVVSIKQKDGSFKNVLIAPSEYTGADGKPTNNWSKTAQFAQGTEQASKDKASLRDLEYSNAKFNATSDQITDPNARAAGLRGLAQYDQEAALAAKVAESQAKAQHDNMQLQLTKRGQDITLAGHENMQKNSARDAAAAKQEKRLSRYKQLLDLHAPTEGLKDADLLAAQARRADMQRAFEVATSGLDLQDMNDKDHDTGVNQAVNQARLSVAVQQAMRKDKAGWNFNNVGKKANTTLGVSGLPAYTYDENNDMLDIGGYKVKGKDVWGDDADLAAFAKTRKPK